MPDELTDQGRILVDRQLGSRIALPEPARSPWWELGRLLAAAAILIGTVLLVYFDRSGYRDGNDPQSNYTVDLIDSIYYTTVTLSTTGYGDIAPVTERARLVNAFLITPARIAFLVLLIGTTLEVLASQGREMFRVARWRKKMGEHIVIVGYGSTRVPPPSPTPTPTAWPSSPATPPVARCSSAPASRPPAT